MPRCEGLPYGPCPHQKNDKTVKYGLNDLFLCKQCEEVRTEMSHTDMNAATTTCSPCNNEQIVENHGNTPTPQSKITQDVEQPSVQALDDLFKLTGMQLPGVYIDTVLLIHQYSAKNIEEVLTQLNMESLNSLRNALCDKATQMFASLKDTRPIKRQVKHKILHRNSCSEPLRIPPCNTVHVS